MDLNVITQMLAASGVGGVAESDLYFNYTTLLLHGDGTNGAQNNTFLDSSTNAFSITRNGNTTQGTFSPFSQTAGYWSAYFSSSYLSVTQQTLTGDVTMEAWIYPTASQNSQIIYGDTGPNAMQLYLTSSNELKLYNVLTHQNSVTQNAWNHIALVRSSGTIRLYLNGVQSSSSYSYSNSSGLSFVFIGGYSNTEKFTGYISNVRIANSAIYTSGFTPSTSPFTTSSQSATSVVFLTCQSNRFVDNSASPLTITANGSPSVQAFSPFAPTAAYDAATNGGSGYFDGSGDYLSVAHNAALNLGTGDFTIEGWIYANSNVADLVGVVGKRSQSDFATGDWRVAWDNDTSKLEITCGLEFDLRLTPVIPKQSWAHFAFTRSSGTLRCYANGVIGDTDATWSHTLNSGTNPDLLIGRNIDGYDFSGYISSLRILKGTALYTGSTYTVPTAPLTNIANTSLLCNFTNAGIIDSTAKNVLETVGNAQIDTGTKKFGTGSLEFDGTGDYILVNGGSNFEFGSGNFTIEAWVYLNSTSGFQIIYDQRTTATQAVPTIYLDGTSLRYYVSGADRITAGTALSTGTWYHIAVSRSGTSTKMFLDGTQTGSTYTDSTSYINGANRPALGVDGGNLSNQLNGYIDDLRITKGVARYTANFTAPTKAFADQ